MSRSPQRWWLITAAITLLPALAMAQGTDWANPERLPPQLQHPLKLLATTAMSGEGKDYYSLKPGQTATVGTVTGPAIIFRIWSTSSNTKLSSLSMIVDGKKESLVAKGALPAGVSNAPLRTLEKQAYWSYLPVLVRKQAIFQATSFEKNVTEPMKFYLQVGYRQMPMMQVQSEHSARSSIAFQKLAQGLAKDPMYGLPKPVTTGPLSPDHPSIFPFGQPTQVDALVMDVDAAATPQQLAATRLMVSCDNVKTMDAPLGLLFGIGHKRTDYTSALFAVQGNRLIIRAPMFFSDRIQIAIDNDRGQGLASLQLAMQSHPLKAAPKYRFCAQTFSQYSVTDQPMTLLNVTGEGIFVGTNLSVDGKDRKTFAFLEGNEQIYIDGDTRPTIEGTGTEDYFNGAWYFEAGEQAHLFSGVTFMQLKDPPKVDCYRYLISDCIPFKQSLRLDLQHGSRNKAPDVLYEGVNFWYQAAPAGVSAPVAAPVSRPTAADGEPTARSPLLLALAALQMLGVFGLLAVLLVVILVLRWLLRRRRA